MNTKVFEKELNKLREELNSLGYVYDGKKQDDIRNADIISTQYSSCLKRLMESLDEEVENYDFFEDMVSNGTSDKEVIDNFISTLNNDTKKEVLQESIEKTKLNEGTSNFNNLEYLPLLVFYTYDDFYGMMEYDSDYPQEEDFEQELENGDFHIDYDAFEKAKEDFEEKYWNENKVCVLDEDDVENLENDLHEFNKETVKIAYEKDLDEDGNQKYENNLSLEDIMLYIENGYYTGCYIDCDGERYFDVLDEDFKEEQLKRFNDFLKDLKKKYQLTTVGVAWGPASNGETGYKILTDEEEVEEKPLEESKKLKEASDDFNILTDNKVKEKLNEDLIVIEPFEAKEKIEEIKKQIEEAKDWKVRKNLLALMNIYLFQTIYESDHQDETNCNINKEEWNEYSKWRIDQGKKLLDEHPELEKEEEEREVKIKASEKDNISDEEVEEKEEIKEEKHSNIELTVEEKNMLDKLTHKNKMDSWFCIDDEKDCIVDLEDNNKVLDTCEAILMIDDGTDNIEEFLDEDEVKLFNDLVARCKGKKESLKEDDTTTRKVGKERRICTNKQVNRKRDAQLKETWAGEDIIKDLTERAQMILEEGADESDAIWQAIDEGLIYTKDIYHLMEHYGSIETSTIIESYYDDLYNDIASGLEDSLKEKKELKEDKRLKEFIEPEEPYKTCGNLKYYVAKYDDVEKEMSGNDKANYTIVTKKVDDEHIGFNGSGLDFATEEDAKKEIDMWCDLKNKGLKEDIHDGDLIALTLYEGGEPIAYVKSEEDLQAWLEADSKHSWFPVELEEEEEVEVETDESLKEDNELSMKYRLDKYLKDNE